MSLLKLTVTSSLLLTALLPGVCLADEFYQSINDVVAHFYQPGNNKEAPWRKEGEADTDYSLCYQKRVNSTASQYLVAMCSESASTDYDALQQTQQGFRLVLEQQNSDGLFTDVVNIGPGKWAVHSS